MSVKESSTKCTACLCCQDCCTHRWLQLAIDAGCAERRVGGQTLVPLTGPRIWYRLHETPLELTDARVVTHDLGLGLIQVLQEDRRTEQEDWREKRTERREIKMRGNGGK